MAAVCIKVIEWSSGKNGSVDIRCLFEIVCEAFVLAKDHCHVFKGVLRGLRAACVLFASGTGGLISRGVDSVHGVGGVCVSISQFVFVWIPALWDVGG